MSRIFRIDGLTETQLLQTAAQIDEGAVAAFATDTVYGIGTQAFDEDAIARIYQIKGRPSQMPMQILLGSIACAQEITAWGEEADKLARAFWPGGLTMILPANAKGRPLLRSFSGLGLRVPAHPFLRDLLNRMKNPLASTSANLHGSPVITREEDLLQFLETKADIILLGGDLSCVASSVVDLTSVPKLLREGAVSRLALEKTLGFGVK